MPSKLWKKTPWGWTAIIAGQRCSVRWCRNADGSRTFIPRVNGNAEASPARAYTGLKSAQAAAEEFADAINARNR